MSQGKEAFHIVRSSKSTNYLLNGNIDTAYKSLKQKYEPKTSSELTRLQKWFYQAKLKKNGDPDLQF
jgi:hypothetical protein